MHKDLQKLSLAGLLISLGIIYGDIGTSPLYVFKAIVGGQPLRRVEGQRRHLADRGATGEAIAESQLGAADNRRAIEP